VTLLSLKTRRLALRLALLIGAFGVLGSLQTLAAQSGISVNLNGENGLNDVGTGIQIVVVMTLLTLAPTLILLMSSFLRVVIVLSFVRQALGTPTTPSNQIIAGLAFFVTLFIMSPVISEVYDTAYVPLQNEQITSAQALEIGSSTLKQFMLRQTRPNDIEFFLALSQQGPSRVGDLPLTTVVPAFILSELRTAFQMGVLIYIPFLVIDFVVASTLMSLGMMMMPPVMIALPFKLLLFVLVDGWYLILRSLVESFNYG